MKLIYSGWLQSDPDLGWNICGINVAPATRTRNVEYAWAAAQANGSLLLDAATGYVDTWHMLPYILCNVPVPRTVIACDMDRRQGQMPGHPAVVRMYGDITDLPFLNCQFDTTFCISVLEHLEPEATSRAAAELLRVTKPGGRLVITADEAPRLPALFGFSEGQPKPQAGMLDPGVYAISLQL